MAKHYLVVSDLHLTDIEEHQDEWKAYKSAYYLFDRELAALLEEFARRGLPEDSRCLILNGDILDFDLITAVPRNPPWPVSSSERLRGLRSTALKSAWKTEQILACHPVFIAALARFLAQGHRIVYILGNHDREMHFNEVRAVFLKALHAAAQAHGEDFPDRQLQFEPWFFYAPGEIYAEHGQQYDYYNSFKNVHLPVVVGSQGPMIALPMGNLSNRYLITQMGFFNPFATDFILNLFAYFWHWVHYYAFSRRSLVLPWFFGSIVVLGKLLATKKRQMQTPREGKDRYATLSSRLGLPMSTLEALSAMQRSPITNKIFRMIREFWFDRLALLILMGFGTFVLALSSAPLWAKLGVPLFVFPLIMVIYETLAKGETVLSIEHSIPKVAASIASLLPARVITFGHDHIPRLLPLEKDVTFVDTGTWAPIMDAQHKKQLTLGYRNYLLISFEGPALTAIHLGSWMERGPR